MSTSTSKTALQELIESLEGDLYDEPTTSTGEAWNNAIKKYIKKSKSLLAKEREQMRKTFQAGQDNIIHADDWPMADPNKYPDFETYFTQTYNTQPLNK